MTVSTDNFIFNEHYRIYLEDTDAGGIVYHANHLKLYERCRRDWLRSLGMASYFYQKHSAESSQPTNMPQEIFPDIQFVVSQATIHYHRPILLDSLVNVAVAKLIAKGSSLQIDQRIYDDNQETHKQLLSQADITLVCVTTTKNADGQTQVRPTRLPAVFMDLLDCNNLNEK